MTGLTRRAVLGAGAALAMAPLAHALRARAQPPTPGLEADVCILGTGPAGAVLAAALLRRGLSVLLIESGPAPDGARDPRFPELERYESIGEIDYPLIATRFRGAGGTSNLWSGTCPRLQPADFDPNPCTPPGARWPIDYDELEPYYLAAERELWVVGVDGAPNLPPRRAPFPRPLTYGQANADQLLRRTGVDLQLAWLPRSNWNGQSARIAGSHLPEIVASPRAVLLADATATGIVRGGDGAVEGIRLESFTAPPRVARARAYVVACGGVESARLLLLSQLGTASDQVGRNFMEHPLVVLGTGTVRVGWDPGRNAEWLCTEQFSPETRRQGMGGLRLRLVTEPAPGADHGHTLKITIRGEIECEPSPTNRVTLGGQADAFGNPGAQLALAFTANDRRAVRYAEGLVWQLLAQLGAEQPHVETGALRWGHHHIGTCRMGDDPRTSVVDRNLRVHGTANLYVAGSAAFVTSGVSNPTLTLTALSLRLAEHLATELRT